MRDSTLTHLLKDSLAGNTKTTLLVCATMDSWNLEETISTMRFATRAKKIKNKTKVQRSVSPLVIKFFFHIRSCKFEMNFHFLHSIFKVIGFFK